MASHTAKILWALIPGSFALGLTGCEVAPDTGNWRGTGVYRDGIHAPVTCNLKLDLTHTDEYVRIHQIGSDCAFKSAYWQAGTFDLHGTSLWKNGRIVGSATSNGAVTIDLLDPLVDDRYPFPAQKVTLSWTRVGSYLEYTEETYFDGKVQRTHGWLRKSDEANFE